MFRPYDALGVELLAQPRRQFADLGQVAKEAEHSQTVA
jgi:hypothetical protein